MSRVVIVGAARTPVGTFNGAFASVPAIKLGQVAVTEALKRAGVPAADVSEVILGQVLTANCGQNPARQTAVNAGIPVEKTALTINQVCGSGLRAVALGYQAILAGDSEVVVADGGSAHPGLMKIEGQHDRQSAVGEEADDAGGEEQNDVAVRTRHEDPFSGCDAALYALPFAKGNALVMTAVMGGKRERCYHGTTGSLMVIAMSYIVIARSVSATKQSRSALAFLTTSLLCFARKDRQNTFSVTH